MISFFTTILISISGPSASQSDELIYADSSREIRQNVNGDIICLGCADRPLMIAPEAWGTTLKASIGSYYVFRTDMGTSCYSGQWFVFDARSTDTLNIELPRCDEIVEVTYQTSGFDGITLTFRDYSGRSSQIQAFR